MRLREAIGGGEWKRKNLYTFRQKAWQGLRKQEGGDKFSFFQSGFLARRKL